MGKSVIVLGLGAMGASACYHLAKRGARVTGIEQFDIGHALGSSHGQSRLIRKAYYEHPNYVPLLERSYELWAELSKGIGREIYHETGLVYFCPESSPVMKGILESARIHGIHLEKLSDQKLATLSDRYRRPTDCVAVFEPKAGYLEVENCILGYAKLAKELGARILPNEKAISWSATDTGVEVVTDKGTHRADHLVVATGAWSDRILKDLGLPLKVLKKTMFWFPTNDSYLESNGTPCFFYETPYGVFYGFPKTDASGMKFAEHSGGTPTENPDSVDRCLNPEELANATRFLKDNLPGMSDQLLSYKTCMYTMTPDENFILDFHPRHKNVAFAAGFSGHGFKFSSVIGEILCDFALNGSTSHPIEFLRMR